MIADLKPYPEYEDSGLLWLGQRPRQWKRMRLKRILRPVDHRSSSGKETLLSLRRDHGVVVYADHFDRPPQGATTIGFKLVQAGQLVVNRMQANNGLVFHSRLSGLVSPDYSVFEPVAPVLMDYLSALLRTSQYKDHFRRESTGLGTGSAGFLRLYDDRLLNTVVQAPPFDEQVAIVRFINWAHGRLEQAIRAKRKVIALLNEQKQAIIHGAVTRGLDASVPLKPSGIPWLGDIPQGWGVCRLKSLCRFVTSGSRGWARYYADSGSVFLRIGNISTTSIDLRLKRISYVRAPSDAEGKRTRALPDDVLLSITAQLGAVGVVPDGLGEAFVNQHTALIRLKDGAIVPRWVAYCLISEFGKGQCRIATNGGTKIGLTLDDVRCLQILMPPFKEQEALVAAIGRQTHDLDTTMRRVEREIEILREYRTRLVADVVTGKLDVREAAAQLTDEAPIDIDGDDTDASDDLELEDEAAAV